MSSVHKAVSREVWFYGRVSIDVGDMAGEGERKRGGVLMCCLPYSFDH